MQSAEEFRASIKERYGFAGWVMTKPAQSVPARRGFVPRQDDLAPFVLERRRALPDQRNAYIDFYRRADAPQVRFSLTVIEHETPEQAHEGLVDFLTTVMAPKLPTVAERGIQAGDVGFAGLADMVTDVFFVTVAVFIRVQSIGEQSAEVKVLAERIDRQVRRHFE